MSMTNFRISSSIASAISHVFYYMGLGFIPENFKLADVSAGPIRNHTNNEGRQTKLRIVTFTHGDITKDRNHPEEVEILMERSFPLMYNKGNALANTWKPIGLRYRTLLAKDFLTIEQCEEYVRSHKIKHYRIFGTEVLYPSSWRLEGDENLFDSGRRNHHLWDEPKLR